MFNELDQLSPQERAAVLLGRLKKSVPPPPVVFDPELIPEVESTYERTETDKQIDKVLDDIDILAAYDRFCGKMQPKIGNKKEGIKISCPIPGHIDKNPSAWINTENQTWYCGGCMSGGDMYDLAAFHFGYAVPGYKSTNFPELRRRMAETFGYVVVTGVTGQSYIVEEEEQEEDESPLASVTQLPGTEEPLPELEVERIPEIFIDWENTVTPGTFLWEWMQACTVDDLPHEFYYWLGLQALGFAGRTDVLLTDFKAVKSNLNICLYGGTGTGKSRAIDPYEKLLRLGLPYLFEDHYSEPTGVSILPSPGSGEAFIDSLSWDLLDPSTNKVIGQAELMGLLKIEEFSSFVSKASRMGSSLKEMIMEVYDLLDRDLAIYTRTSGTTTAKNPFCQIVTTTQPNAIHAFLRKTDTESGFLNRWIFAAGKSRIQPIPIGGITVDVTNSAKKLEECRQWASTRHELTLMGDARETWTDFFNEVIAPIKTGKTYIDSMFARIDLTLKKLIVLLTINEKLASPTAQIVQQAINLYPYLEATYSIFSKDIAFSEAGECQHKILNIVATHEAKHKVKPTRRDIMRKLRSKFDLDTVNRTMKLLVSVELLKEEASKPGGRGRPTTRYSCGN